VNTVSNIHWPCKNGWWGTSHSR